MRLLTALLVLVAAGPAAAAADSGMSPRIVGPNLTPAVAADWPFIALVAPGPHLCGGSVINARWVLTAAHCAVVAEAAATRVYPGAYFQSSPGAAITPEVSRVHPSWNPVTVAWDFALLRLPAPTTATAVALPSPSDDSAITAAQTAGTAGALNARIAGWGLTSCTPDLATPGTCQGPPADATSDGLQSINGGIPLLSDPTCAGFYSTDVIAEVMLCAGNRPAPGAQRNDSCAGDSGGPLTPTATGRGVVVGVTSWGYLCGTPDRPGVYARVTAARDWICDTVTSPTAITAAPGIGSASVTWTPDTATCAWRDPVVRVVASPGGATATAPLSAGGLTLGGLSAGTDYTLSAGVSSSSGASPPAASATVVPTAPAPPPAPPVAVPCTQTFYQQAARTARTQAAPDGASALRVVSRIRIYEDAEAVCRTDLTVIVRDARTGKRLPQLAGSTLGYRRLTGKDFSAPVVSWPAVGEFRFAGSDPTGLNRKDARLVLVSYVKRVSPMPSPADIELVVVRRIPDDPAQAFSSANPMRAQKNAFGVAVGWATVS